MLQQNIYSLHYSTTTLPQQHVNNINNNDNIIIHGLKRVNAIGQKTVTPRPLTDQSRRPAVLARFIPHRIFAHFG